MDIGLREIIFIIGFLLIAGIIFDGYRRMRVNRKKADELSLGLSGGGDYYDDCNGELPHGGARLIKGQAADDGEQVAPKKVEPHFQQDAAEESYSEPSSNHFDQSFTDTRQEALHQHLQTARQKQAARQKQSATDPVSPIGDQEPPVITDKVNDGFADTEEPLVANPADHVSPLSMNSNAYHDRRKVLAKGESTHKASLLKNAADGLKTVAKPSAKDSNKVWKQSKKTASDTASVEDSTDTKKAVEDIIVIHVIAKSDTSFAGDALLALLTKNGLRFGDMNIFHCYDSSVNRGEKGALMFSMANGIEPGTFDLDNMSEYSTPAVSFFMSLPGPDKPMRAFEQMALAAHDIASTFGGSLKDENRSVMTQQTLEHCKQRIMDYERRHLVRKQMVR
ncbi:cell division protein ZipA [Zooshikella ganghwensis]|uniref:Cell division protein ZipA n=1 Tax=Zooshikella ganghwensis TaxID=202772 RepID=A0A4P9VLL5_9GAMM|nr:cell division protein ZipA [Zooshikella ganghwensis]RDH43449.1 cell division protein ZipA [Zooshikella ganghwensis]